MASLSDLVTMPTATPTAAQPYALGPRLQSMWDKAGEILNTDTPAPTADTTATTPEAVYPSPGTPLEQQVGRTPEDLPSSGLLDIVGPENRPPLESQSTLTAMGNQLASSRPTTNSYSGIGSTLGGVVGAAFGGPAGGAIGSGLGGAAGSLADWWVASEERDKAETAAREARKQADKLQQMQMANYRRNEMNTMESQNWARADRMDSKRLARLSEQNALANAVISRFQRRRAEAGLGAPGQSLLTAARA